MELEGTGGDRLVSDRSGIYHRGRILRKKGHLSGSQWGVRHLPATDRGRTAADPTRAGRRTEHREQRRCGAVRDQGGQLHGVRPTTACGPRQRAARVSPASDFVR